MKYMFLMLLLVYSLLVAYAVWRGCVALRGLPVLRNVWLSGSLVLYVCLLAGTWAGMHAGFPGARVVAFVGHTAIIVFLYLIVLFLLTDLVCLVVRVAGWASGGMGTFRRGALGAGVLVIVAVLVAGNWRFNHPQVVEMELSPLGRPVQGRELRLLLVSDVHLGVSIGKERLQHYVDLINARRPDAVLLAGDVFDNALAPVERQHMHEELARLRAPLGVYAVPGNHEYIGGQIDTKMAYLERGGVRVLRDSAVLLGGEVYVVGRDDRTNLRRKPLAELMEPLVGDKPVIVLDHQPYHLEEAEACGADLQLSGHTHDGQFFPVNLVVRSMYENPHGYSRRGQTHYYVSSGLGIWGPQYRIGTRSEMVLIRFLY